MTTGPSRLSPGLAGLRYPITQVSLAVRDLHSTMALYHRAFGWGPWQVFSHVPPVHHRTELRGEAVNYALTGAEVYVGSLNFELLEPLRGPSLWTEFINQRGEGIASIATMFQERRDGDAVKVAFSERFGIDVIMKADIGNHIEYYYLDTGAAFGCLIESGSGHAIDFVRPAEVFPDLATRNGPSPMSGLTYPITQVSLVVRDLPARMKAYHDAFGWGPWKVYEGSLIKGEYRGQAIEFAVRFAQAQVDETNFELIQPLGGPGPWQEFLDTRGEGLCGIAMTLRSPAELERAEKQFAELGVGVLVRGKVAESGDWLVLNSQQDFKCLIQIGTGHSYDRVDPERVYS